MVLHKYVQIREKQSGETRGKSTGNGDISFWMWGVPDMLARFNLNCVGEPGKKENISVLGFSFTKMWILTFRFGEWGLQLLTDNILNEQTFSVFSFGRLYFSLPEITQLTFSISPGSFYPTFSSVSSSVFRIFAALLKYQGCYGASFREPTTSDTRTRWPVSHLEVRGLDLAKNWNKVDF